MHILRTWLHFDDKTAGQFKIFNNYSSKYNYNFKGIANIDLVENCFTLAIMSRKLIDAMCVEFFCCSPVKLLCDLNMPSDKRYQEKVNPQQNRPIQIYHYTTLLSSPNFA